MKRLIWDALKIFVIFVTCACLFYFGIHLMHQEYENYHRYDSPEGSSMKVFNDRLNLFFD